MDPNDNQQTNREKPLLTKARVLLFITLYTPFFGYSYLRGLLHAVGFRNPNIEASPQELVFQALSAFGESFSLIFGKDIYLTLAKTSLSFAIMFAIYFPLFYLTRNIFLAVSSSEHQNSGLSSKLASIIKQIKVWFENQILILKLVYSTVSGFVFGFLISYVAAFLVIFSILTLVLVMFIGNIIGSAVGENHVGKDICIEKEWGQDEHRRLGCTIVELSSPFQNLHSLKGWRLHDSDSSIYFLTNEGAYELSSNLTVKQFTPIHKNESHDKDDLPAQKQD